MNPRTTLPRPVLVIGEALVDCFADGTQVAGGAPFNQARWLAALGLPVRMLTRIGAHDAGAACVLASARLCGLDEAAIQRDEQRPTGRVLVTLAEDGPRYRIEPDSAWEHIDAAAAREQAQALAPGVIVFGSLALRAGATRAAIDSVLHAATPAAAAASASAPNPATAPPLRFLDLNLRETPALQELAAEALKRADWVKLNDEELERLLGWFVCDGPPPREGPLLEQALAELAARFAVQRWVVTCGARGWFTLDGQGRREHAGPAPLVPHLVDTVGAGDAFSAVLVAGIAAAWPLPQALAAAAQLAAAVCTVRGALPEDAAFLRHWRERLALHRGTPHAPHDTHADPEATA